MTSGAAQVSAESQRRRIPERWQLTFVQVTDDELAGMASDDKLRPEVRAYALWELEYREAFGVEVYYDDKGDAIKRRRTR